MSALFYLFYSIYSYSFFPDMEKIELDQIQYLCISNCRYKNRSIPDIRVSQA